MSKKRDWDKEHYHGRSNMYPFTEVVSFVMDKFSHTEDRSKVRIIDLGCGGANHLLFLAQEGFDYYGVDGADQAINIASERLEARGFEARNLAVSSFDELPYEDNFFDCVIDRGSLVCNGLSDLPRIINELHRICKPGGYCFSMILNEASTSKDKAEHLGNSDYTRFEGRLEGAGIYHYTNADEAQKLFSRFTIEDIQLMFSKSEFLPSGNKEMFAWTSVIGMK